MKDRLFNLKNVLILVLVFFICACANVVAPTGGEKDESPPVVLRSDPPNYSVNYSGENVRIFFDEFVTLQGLRESLLVSPPLNTNPEVRIRGRSIIMSISDTLLPNTTYNFFFGESVVDITEGNPIPNFQYVVSTGDYVDSLSVQGVVLNAFTRLPEDSVFVMMYENVNVADSAPLLHRPVYLTKTGEDGEFQINNVKDGEYLLFALKDLNSNFIYDNPDEQIAFLDSLIKPTYFGFGLSGQLDVESILNDSLVSDDIQKEVDENETLSRELNYTDSLLIDSLIAGYTSSLPYYEMFLFQERDTVQRVVSAGLARKGKVNIVFRIRTDSVEIRDYQHSFDDGWFMPEFNGRRDSLALWLPSVSVDSLFLEISDRGHIIDSVKVSLIPRADRSRIAARRETDEEPVVEISVPGLISGGVHPFFKPFEMLSQTPLKEIKSENFQLYLNDSIKQDTEFTFADSLQRRIQMDFMPEQDSTYVLLIPSGSMTDIFGVTNDSLEFKFKVNNSGSYGTLILGLTLPDENIVLSDEIDKQYILQLLNEGLTRVIDEKIITGGGTYQFNHLPAGTFRFRLVEDKNMNNKWDTGHYLPGIQPEPVVISPENVTTRINWEIEILWAIENL
jgi:uncharacterized protein (DUF2141 family)